MDTGLMSKLRSKLSTLTNSGAKTPDSAPTEANPTDGLPTVGETVRRWIAEGKRPVKLELVNRGE